MAIQVILNISVVTNTIPNTGITLPFISYGGTSVVFLLAEMGLALSVSSHRKEKQHRIKGRGLLGSDGLDKIRITGGKPLQGTISIQGSKNSALPMMAASLLHRGVSVLKGCPAIADVYCMEDILRSLGALTWWEKNTLYLDCSRADGTEVSGDSTGKMRSSVILLGALLARNKKGSMGYPGGCVIGKRPVDQHLYVLRCLGACVQEKENSLEAEAGCLKGAEIVFGKISVGATEQGILAAVLAEGHTVLRNCAREPEIVWLCRYLRSMGAEIQGEGTHCIRITGVKELKAGNMQIPPDRIVAGTYLCAAAATRGKITISNPPEGELDAFLEVYGKMGGQYNRRSGKLIADGSGTAFPVPFLVNGYVSGVSHRSSVSSHGSTDNHSGEKPHTGKYF